MALNLEPHSKGGPPVSTDVALMSPSDGIRGINQTLSRLGMRTIPRLAPAMFHGHPTLHMATILYPPTPDHLMRRSHPTVSNEQPGFNSSPMVAPVSFATPVHTFENQQPTTYVSPQTSYEPQPSSYDPPSSAGYTPPSDTGYEPPSNTGNEPLNSTGYEPPNNTGYEPRTGGYEPPSYEPATMDDESPIEPRPKNKSFMDDDDDDIPAPRRAPDSQEKSKAEEDREADEAFRKAAEADGNVLLHFFDIQLS